MSQLGTENNLFFKILRKTFPQALVSDLLRVTFHNCSRFNWTINVQHSLLSPDPLQVLISTHPQYIFPSQFSTHHTVFAVFSLLRSVVVVLIMASCTKDPKTHSHTEGTTVVAGVEVRLRFNSCYVHLHRCFLTSYYSGKDTCPRAQPTKIYNFKQIFKLFNPN